MRKTSVEKIYLVKLMLFILAISLSNGSFMLILQVLVEGEMPSHGEFTCKV